MLRYLWQEEPVRFMLLVIALAGAILAAATEYRVMQRVSTRLHQAIVVDVGR